MNKKIATIILIILIIITSLLIIYPNIEIKNNNKLYYFTYKEDISIFEENMCYDESYAYNKKHDISIYNWEYKNFLFFKLYILSYKEGNICQNEFILKEEYIKRFIQEAQIKKNEDNINIEELIKNKKPIIKNKRYPWNENYHYIGYILDGKYQEMYISKNEDDLLIIQVGHSDDGPKYIAYK